MDGGNMTLFDKYKKQLKEKNVTFGSHFNLEKAFKILCYLVEEDKICKNCEAIANSIGNLHTSKVKINSGKAYKLNIGNENEWIRRKIFTDNCWKHIPISISNESPTDIEEDWVYTVYVDNVRVYRTKNFRDRDMFLAELKGRLSRGE